MSEPTVVPHESNAEATGQKTQPDPCVVVVFGATGDLTKRKLVPALFDLWAEKQLPNEFAILGVARREQSADDFRDGLEEWANRFSHTANHSGQWDDFAKHIDYFSGSFDDEKSYVDLAAKLAKIDETRGTSGNRMFYLAVPPEYFPVVIQNLQKAELVYPVDANRPCDGCWSRVIVEKPIGTDLESACELNQLIGDVLDETQTYRIDHFLGKEAVQNILVFRFGNAIFEALWNRKHVEHVQITMSEDIDIEGRGAFFDSTGILRDVVQNHLLQVLALCAMEPPTSFTADDIRTAKVQVLRALRPITGLQVEQEVVRAQYDGYRDENGVPNDSRTPTYVAMKLLIDNWRWKNVPFYLRAGKALGSRVTEVSIHFEKVPHLLFGENSGDTQDFSVPPNVLTLRIQPDEGISLRFASKIPGEEINIGSFDMNMLYSSNFDKPLATAYERLLLDCWRGDATLFARRDEVEEAWRFISPILEAWELDRLTPVATYPKGSAGPTKSDRLVARDGFAWDRVGQAKKK